MSIKKPDILEHKNSNYPIVSSLNALGGHHEVADTTARNSIPIERRRLRMLVSYNDGSSEITKKFTGGAVDDVTWSNESSWITLTDKVYVDSIAGKFEVKNDAETSSAGFGTDGSADTFQQKLGANTIYAGLIGTNTIAFGPPITNTLTGGNNVILGTSDFTSGVSIVSSIVLGSSVGAALAGTGNVIAGYLAVGSVTASTNTVAIGRQVASNATVLSTSVILGYTAASSFSNIDNCVFIGDGAALTVSGSANESIFIGHSAGSGLANDPTNVLVINSIGTGTSSTAIIYGEQNVTAANQRLNLNAGHIYMDLIPTSDPSTAGRIYVSGGALMVSAGGGECITGDALISLTEDTVIRFDRLSDSMNILTFNEDAQVNEIHSFEEVVVREHTSLIRIELENGVVIKSTLSHPWMSEEGWVSFDVVGALKYYDVETILFGIGTKLKMQDNSVLKIVAYNTFEELQTTYHIKGVENNNYYANRILTAAMQ